MTICGDYFTFDKYDRIIFIKVKYGVNLHDFDNIEKCYYSVTTSGVLWDCPIFNPRFYINNRYIKSNKLIRILHGLEG